MTWVVRTTQPLALVLPSLPLTRTFLHTPNCERNIHKLPFNLEQNNHNDNVNYSNKDHLYDRVDKIKLH